MTCNCNVFAAKSLKERREEYVRARARIFNEDLFYSTDEEEGDDRLTPDPETSSEIGQTLTTTSTSIKPSISSTITSVSGTTLTAATPTPITTTLTSTTTTISTGMMPTTTSTHKVSLDTTTTTISIETRNPETGDDNKLTSSPLSESTKRRLGPNHTSDERATSGSSPHHSRNIHSSGCNHLNSPCGGRAKGRYNYTASIGQTTTTVQSRWPYNYYSVSPPTPLYVPQNGLAHVLPPVAGVMQNQPTIHIYDYYPYYGQHSAPMGYYGHPSLGYSVVPSVPPGPSAPNYVSVGNRAIRPPIYLYNDGVSHYNLVHK
eukprot:TRINITY_DN4328_c0_g1_i9.p1 TRINITY_DN4328_c0_g1~~TRINITY_DN4328_c0_g1_i9.p1  ORF type:complete len:317 (-),score=43.20 TRINITY_DN4328_c0_g1_i9:297-1247(-)